jgi:glucose/arabinose dehydrogenase
MPAVASAIRATNSPTCLVNSPSVQNHAVTMASPTGRTALVDQLAGRPAGLAWSADGHLLASGTEDGAAALWRMPRG